MIRPRWQDAKERSNQRFLNRWNKAIAILAMANISWVIFDINYIPLRSFLIQPKLIVLKSNLIKVPNNKFINPIKIYDRAKGIKPHANSQEYIESFNQLSELISRLGINNTKTMSALGKHSLLSVEFLKEMEVNSIPHNRKNLLAINNRLRQKSSEINRINAINKLFSVTYLEKVNWENEKLFWEGQIINRLRSNYSYRFDSNGNQISNSWKIDLPFQLIFLIDVIFKTYNLKRKFKGITLRDAFLKSWLDIPLFLPVFRILRIVPVTAKLSNAKLIQLEPIRAVISQWIVALLAIEIFEVLTLRIIDSFQVIIKSPNLASKVRGLRSHQSINKDKANNLSDFLRLWIPLLLQKVGPNLRPQIIALLNHSLQKSMKSSSLPIAFKGSPLIGKAESAISLQLALGMTDAILDLSKNTANKISEKDLTLNKLSVDVVDRFWEELAYLLENEVIRRQSQELITSFLEELKISSFRQFKNQLEVNEIIKELDLLNFNSERNPSN
ncbi:hypothetical protein [Prochlorococcus marinus]|uniref:Uncharacterized protein n=1 Tax=Prochlorococcus marinus (strain MIT 9211) TaxID=93059 RepID=A9BED5_PROM4|nr:hypothetical protein [Prochlorococcus marinus]ABX08445.1 Hypothetical protein P9211_05141 [Prochlorococcus marinus str. MIT 9211]